MNGNILKNFKRYTVMKKILLISIFCLLGTPVFSSSTDTSWWQSRIQNLEAEKKQLSSTSYYSMVAPVINEDIKRTEELVSYIEDEISGRNRHRRHFGEDYLEKTIEDAALGAFSVLYTRFMLDELSDAKNIASAKEHLKKSTENLILSHFPDANSEAVEKIRTSTVPSQFSTSYSHEMILQALLQAEITRKTDFLNRAVPQLREKFSGSAAAVSSVEKDALKLASEESAKWENDSLEYHNALLETSAVWKDLSLIIDTQCTSAARVRALLKESAMDYSVENSLYYAQHLRRLEAEMFSKKDADETQRTSYAKQAINLARKNTLNKCAGSVTQEEFNEAVRLFVHTADEVRSKYDFSPAETSIVDNYTEKSHAYFMLVYQINRIPHEAINKNASYRLERFAQYSDRLEKLNLQSYLLSHKTIAAMDRDISTATTLMKNEMKYLGFNATILPSYRTHLSKSELAELLNRKQNTTTRISNNSIAVSSVYDAYLQKSDAFNRSMAENRSESASDIASMELQVLHDTVRSYHAEWKSLAYSSTFLKAYRRTFNENYELLKEGRLPENIDSVVAEKSLTHLMSLDAVEKLQNQRKAREYLASAIKRDIVRFNKLKEQYKSREVEIEGAPSSAELYAIQSELSEIPEVRVSSWRMNEVNFAEVDRKAAYLLTQLYRKNVWEGRSLPAGSQREETRQITLSGKTLSIAIPEGWEEKKQGASQSKTYISNYDNSAFTVMVIQGVSEKDAVDSWIKNNGLTKVQLGWEEQGERLCFWNIAKGDDNSVSKVLAYSENGTTILLCGTAEKERYPFFHNRIDTVFKSINN